MLVNKYTQWSLVKLAKKTFIKKKPQTWRSTAANAPSVKRLNPSHDGLS